MKRAWIALPVLLLVAVAMWRPPGPAAVAIATSAPSLKPPAFKPPAFRPSRSVVYVVGAVARPGLYTLEDGARVDDAVRAAGGLLRGADPAGVNLAARTNDGDEIDVPLIGETPVHRRASRAKPTHGRRTSRTRKAPAIVDLNTAGASDLQNVPGIGATLAARIVDVRAHDGPFSSYEQLLDVAGMTQARLDRAEPYLRVRF